MTNHPKSPLKQDGEIHEVQASPDANQWQPIETAPRNEEWCVVGKISDGKLLWWYRAMFWRKGWHTARSYDTQVVPTHWLPLPEPSASPVQASVSTEGEARCTCLASGNQVAWEYVHHTNDCPVFTAGEQAKQWLLNHPQLKGSRIFAGAAAWDRETVATLLVQYAARAAATTVAPVEQWPTALDEIEAALISIADGVSPQEAVGRAFNIINAERARFNAPAPLAETEDEANSDS